MRWTLLLAALCGCSAGPRAAVTLEPSAPREAPVPPDTNGLVEALGSEDPAGRDEAAAALTRLGPPVLPLLERLQRTHADAEVRARAASIADAVRLSLRGFTVRDEWFAEDEGRLGSYMIRTVDVRGWRVPVRFQNRGGERGFTASIRPSDWWEELRTLRRRGDLVASLRTGATGAISPEIASILAVLLLAIDDPAAANAFIEVATARKLRRTALLLCLEFPKYLSRADAEHERKLLEAFRDADVLEGLRIGIEERPLHRYLVWMGSGACVEAVVRRAAAGNRLNTLECLTEFTSEPGFKALLESLPGWTAAERDRLRRAWAGRRDLDEIRKQPWFDAARLEEGFR